MNKIISNKYIYVGIISALGLGLIITLFITFYTSNDIEGDWSLLIDKSMISLGVDKTLTKEEIAEHQEMVTLFVKDSFTYSFNDEKLLLNGLELATWSINDGNLSLSPLIDSIEIKEHSPQLSPWNYSKKSNWKIDFKNDSTMVLKSLSDTTLILTFQKR